MAITTITSITSATKWPSSGQRTDLNSIISTVNSNFVSLTSGTTVLPKTVLTVNGRPVLIPAGNLQLVLSDIPGAASNAHVAATFASNSYVSSLNTNLNAKITGANLAIQTLYNSVGNLSSQIASANSVVTTSLISGWIQANISTLSAAWTANAGAQGISLDNIASALTNHSGYANVQLGYLSTYVADLQSNAATQGASLIALTANAATQAGQIASIGANLGAYQTTVNANLGTATTNIGTLQSQVVILDASQTYSNVHIGNLYTDISELTDQINAANAAIVTNSNSIVTANSAVVSYVNAVNSRMVSNVTAANAAIADLLSTINSVSDALDSFSSYANVQIGNESTTDDSLLSRINAANVLIDGLTANAGSQAASITTLLSNAASQAASINAINANVTAANVAIADLQSNVGAFESYANTSATSVAVLNANIGSYQLYANTAIDQALSETQSLYELYYNIEDVKIAPYLETYTGNLSAGNVFASAYFFANGTPFVSGSSGTTYSNTNVAAYLTTSTISTTGNINAANVSINGNIAVVSTVARQVFVSNIAPTSGQGSIGDIWYQTF